MNPLLRLGELGQSVWYDYITRDLLASGELARLIAADGLRGMTSNPTIFDKAVAGSRLYDQDIRRLADRGAGAGEIFEALAVADVRAACDAFLPLYERSGKGDGLVSLEVSPTLAHDTEATVQEAERLWAALSRPNAMIKIPGTQAGLPAITRCIAAGINVNVTLLFSVERYAEVIDAFLAGMEQRLEQQLPVASVVSVASFFVSRVDGKIDPVLDRTRIAGSRRPSAGLAGSAWPRPAPSRSGHSGRPPAPRIPGIPTPTTSRHWSRLER
jgi:transaldolase